MLVMVIKKMCEMIRGSIGHSTHTVKDKTDEGTGRDESSRGGNRSS